MIGGLFRLLFFIFIGYIVLKLIFQIGKTAGEFNQRVDDMNRSKNSSRSGRKGDIIELDKDQYKVE